MAEILDLRERPVQNELIKLMRHELGYRYMGRLDTDSQQFVHDNYWELEGKVFSYGDVLLYATKEKLPTNQLKLATNTYLLNDANLSTM